MQDKVITCRDCDKDFIFTVSEQEFFAEKGFTNLPSRCPECRAARKQNQRRNTSGRGASFNNRQRQESYPATCARCGMTTQVPFRPSEDRPVYCRECYESQKRYSSR